MSKDIYMFSKESGTSKAKIAAALEDMVEIYFSLLQRNGLENYKPIDAYELCETLNELSEKEDLGWKMSFSFLS